MNSALLWYCYNERKEVYQMGKKYGVSFSWKRLLGISGLKGKVAKKTGIPLTKSGIERKIGRTILDILFKSKPEERR